MSKSIVFDMDGIIFDSEQLVLKTWKTYAGEYNLDNIEEAFLSCVGTTRESTRKRMHELYGQDFKYDEFREKASALFHKTAEQEGLPVKKGVRELLEYLKNENFKIGLASSTRMKIVEKELKQADLFSYFDVVIGGDLLKKSKPEPDIYLMACKELKVNPKDTYAVEDSYNGIKSAYNAGMKAVMVPDLLKPTEEITKLCYVICKDLLEVKEVLKND